ncbi:MAG TPA: glycosyltransferase [Candidatus Binatia bacterium]|nr:glycosyltransferase [Candidatus Binatia bacterium]
MHSRIIPEVSVIVPARNEEACLADCLRTLAGQAGPQCEIIVVDDHSTDATRGIAEAFPAQVIAAPPLPPGWCGKCNAAWSGARVARGKWLLFTDADTRHAANSIAAGLEEARECGAALLSWSPRQEVHSFAQRALMPVIFAELATTYRTKDVCDPNSPAAAANGQYLLIRRDVYDAVGGHAAVAGAILEDVELAGRVKRAGHSLRFRRCDLVSTRMYRSFFALWEGWTKNLALLFPHPRRLAFRRLLEFAAMAAPGALAMVQWIRGDNMTALAAAALATLFLVLFFARLRRAHFDRLSNSLAIFGLPLFAALLVNSAMAHRRGAVSWKGRTYGVPDRGSMVVAAGIAPRGDTGVPKARHNLAQHEAGRSAG